LKTDEERYGRMYYNQEFTYMSRLNICHNLGFTCLRNNVHVGFLTDEQQNMPQDEARSIVELWIIHNMF